MQRGNIGTFLQSRMNVNILRSDRHSECFLIVTKSVYVLTHINYPLTSMQPVSDEYQL